jgi:serine phosphatase RsbU (regulator of sigma subunit)
MSTRFVLPAPPAPPARSLADRARVFFLQSWPGRTLLAAIAVEVVGLLGLPLPSGVAPVVGFILAVFGVYGFFRLFRVALRALLWRIRSKLILSYLFIGLVPIVLASAFFVLAVFLLVSLVAAHLVTAEIDRMTGTLATVAETVLPSLPSDDAAAARVIEERLAPARTLHQRLAFSLVRRGQVIASAGDAPRALPAWWKGESFAGYVSSYVPSKPRLLRAVRSRAANEFLLLEVPVDAELFGELERRTGIHVLTEVELEPSRGGPSSGEEGPSPGVNIVAEGDHGEKLSIRSGSGLFFVAIPEQTDWDNGDRAAIHPVPFRFHPLDLLKSLAPGFKVEGKLGSLTDLLVIAMGVVGAFFLVMYAVALLLGLLLARSITRSVHALSLGTERLRHGDFDHAIAVRSRDQLGELAESFNHMSQGVKALLREQTEKERLEEELRIARQIQMSLLPAQGAVTMPGVRIAALCLPAAEVGGDYYDLLPLSDTRLGVLVADVSGKGTSAALYMAELKGLVLSLSRIYASPAKLLIEANRILAANLDSRSFITMTYAVVDMVEGTMRYARAGHNPIIQMEAASGKTRVLVPQGLGLGIDRGERFEEILEEAVTPLRQGDIFLFFTDGLSEAMNGRSELFGETRLRDIVESVEGLTSEEIKERILFEIRGFVGEAAPHDDMTLVVLKVA